MMKARNISLFALILILVSMPYCNYGQLKQIATGSNANLRDLSVINDNIMVSGYFGYLAKSTNECNNLTPLTIPGPSGYATRICRLDTSTVFLISFTPSQMYLFKSTDGGYNWVQKFIGSGDADRQFGFYDTLNGIMSRYWGYYTTNDGGNSWTPHSFMSQIGITALKTYGDSMVAIGGITVPNGTGSFSLSLNRGVTWASSWGFWKEPSDFFFLNKDTIFAISNSGEFTKTVNKGSNWDNLTEIPLYKSYSVAFKNRSEGFVVGSDPDGFGTIVKTTNLGQTWSSYNTGIKTTLMNIAFLNDSIALLSGTGGVLLRWNYKKTVFTNVNSHSLKENIISVFPNPFRDKFVVECNKSSLHKINVIVTNSLGSVVFENQNFEASQEINLSSLPAGVYFVKVGNTNFQSRLKLIKE